MSTITIRQLNDILPQVGSQTSPDAPIADRFNEKHTYTDWIKIAQAVSHDPKVNQLTLALQYRTHSLKDEAAAPVDPLKERFKQLSAKLFPQGIPEDFAARQINHLSAKYPAFAQTVLEAEELAISFFRFCLQAPSQSSHRRTDATHWVDIFVLYPEVAERLMKCCLFEKLGQFPENIQLVNTVPVMKIDSLDGIKWISLQLNKKNTQVHFKNRVYTVEEIFEDASCLDVSSKGIISVNSEFDPHQWVDEMPSSVLMWPELTTLYPNAGEPSYALVLRANSLFPKGSYAYFDFIKKLADGNYRVISFQSHQKPGFFLYQQKSAFYALTAQQADTVIKKVADDLKKGSKTIDIQPYIDDVLGEAFYTHLSTLLKVLFPYSLDQTKDQLIDQLTEARKNLDTAAFEAIVRPVVDKLIKDRDMDPIQKFIETSLTTISTVLGKKIDLPTLDEVKAAALAGNLTQMSPSLLALSSICFEVLHPFRMKVADAEKEAPIVGRIFAAIEAIPWVWLKNLLTQFFLTILGPFRGYHYKTLETAHLDRMTRVVRAIRNLKPEEYVNRPSQFFQSFSEETKSALKDRISACLKDLRISATPSRQ
jgi:hypothetical protein